MMRWLRSVIAWVKNLFKRNMRRKISLYIADRLVDLDDQSFILFNYTMDDLSNPTIVKNSFSQQITLKGTPANNQVFGDYFRVDRNVVFSGEGGVAFNPSVKTPFSIYNELGEILESGYVKLDSIDKRGADIQYKVTLYGGLGSFLYALSYDESGNKRTLADLDYLGNGDPAELDFTIDKNTIEDAWDDLWDIWSGGSPGTKWEIINFAPAYNGNPDNFSADKGLLSLPGAGLPADKDGYSPKSGYGLVNLANPQDEWAVKDLRSYLQRPVLSIKAFLDAICNPANNGGYSVAYGDLNNWNVPYKNLWLTLPTIPSLGSAKQSGEGLSVTMTSSASTGNEIGRYDISWTIPSGAMVNATLKSKLRFNLTGADAHNTLSLEGNNNSGSLRFSILFLQMVAYASDNTKVGGSKVMVMSPISRGYMDAVRACGFTPPYPTDQYEWFDSGSIRKVTNGVFEADNELTFQVEAQNAAYYKLMAYAYSGTGALIRGVWHYNYSGTGSNCRVTLYASYSSYWQVSSALLVAGSGNSVTKTDTSELRSGAKITKWMLLSTSATPADYLLSLCKMFGLYFVMDSATKQITIMTRNSLYTNETIDLTGRVDLSKGISIKPLVFESKWYDFMFEGVGGAFYDEYLNVEGIPYGMQRVNTGFDFNAEAVNLMDSSVFKNAVTILARSRYWNIIENGAVFFPSPFLDNGNTITRWNADDETLDTPISCPPTFATITYYNSTYNGYDVPMMCKCEFADSGGKMVDGKDVLVFLSNFNFYQHFKITDDLPVMAVVNDGKPCWILDDGEGVQIPIFSRYDYFNGEISYSLDFGVPRQLDIPGITYIPGGTLYALSWKKYLTDRYDVNSKVLTCRVDFSGMQVSHELLRKFYWFDNALWVLNKITNYSLTTYDPVECEFVQVQNKQNYIEGQFIIERPV